LNTSGALVVGWDDGTRSSADVGTAAKEEIKRHADRALEKAAYVAISSTLGKFTVCRFLKIFDFLFICY